MDFKTLRGELLTAVGELAEGVDERIDTKLERHNEAIDKKLDEMEAVFTRRQYDSGSGGGDYVTASSVTPASDTKALRSAFGADGDEDPFRLLFAKYGPPECRKEAFEQLSDAERKTFVETAGGGADLLLPEALSGTVLATVLPKTIMAAAGVGSIPIPAGTTSLNLVGFDGTIPGTFRNEGDGWTDATPGTRKVTLTPKMLSVSVRYSLESGLDVAGLADRFRAEIGRAFAQGMDQAVIDGDPVNKAPEGIFTHVTGGDIGSTDLLAVAPTDYDKVIDAITAVRNGDFEPNALIWNPTQAGEFAKLKASGTGDYLRPPEDVANLKRLTSTAVPAGKLAVGDFSNVVIGLRNQLAFQADPYSEMGASGTIVLRAYMRMDVAVLNYAALHALVNVG